MISNTGVVNNMGNYLLFMPSISSALHKYGSCLTMMVSQFFTGSVVCSEQLNRLPFIDDILRNFDRFILII